MNKTKRYYYYCKLCDQTIIRDRPVVVSLCGRNRMKSVRLIEINKMTYQNFWQLKKLLNSH